MAERRGRRARGALEDVPVRTPQYRGLVNPFTPQRVFSDDEVAALHANALRVLQELGLKVLLPEARAVFGAAGALVDEDTEMVRIGADIVEAALAGAPAEFTIRGGDPKDDVWFGPGSLVFIPGAGCPNATDRLRGRRPGSRRDFEELTTLTAGFDALHMQCRRPDTVYFRAHFHEA